MEKVPHMFIFPFFLHFLMGNLHFFVKHKNPKTDDFSTLGNWDLDNFVHELQKFVNVLDKELAFFPNSGVGQKSV